MEEKNNFAWNVLFIFSLRSLSLHRNVYVKLTPGMTVVIHLAGEAIVYLNCRITIHLQCFDLVVFSSNFCNAKRCDGINIHEYTARNKTSDGNEISSELTSRIQNTPNRRMRCSVCSYFVQLVFVFFFASLLIIVLENNSFYFFWHTWVVAEFHQTIFPWTVNTIRHTSNPPKCLKIQIYFFLRRWSF